MNISSYLVVDTTDSMDLERRSVPKPGILQWVLVLGLCSVLIFAILAFGAVEEWSTFIFEAGAAVLFLIWAGQQLVSRQLKLSNNPLYPPALVFFVLLLAQLVLRTSAYSYVTKYGALQYFSYGIVLLIAAECVREETDRKNFALAMIGFGALYAFFALAQSLTSEGKFFWVYTPRFHGAIYGSYVNHDHYAGLMEMLVPFPLVVSMGHRLRGGKRALVAFAASIDGQHHLSFRLAWRNAFFRCRNCVVWGPDSDAEKKFSRCTRLDRSVCIRSFFPRFCGEGAGSGATRRSRSRHPFEYE